MAKNNASNKPPPTTSLPAVEAPGAGAPTFTGDEARATMQFLLRANVQVAEIPTVTLVMQKLEQIALADAASTG